MQRISLHNLKPGMVVARNIYSADGQLMLCADVTLTAAYIKRLLQLEIASVYIKHASFPDLEMPEILREETRVQTTKNIKKVFENVQICNKLELSALQPTIQTIVAEITRNRNAMIHLTDVRLYDDYTFAHSVNVCALATMIAVTRDYTPARLGELALGALLHDIGKTLVPLNILNKPGKLSDDEFMIMRTHSEAGFELLRKSCAEMSVVPMHVAYQHQERYDGKGYPRGLKEGQIHEYARIVAIADVYDALTSDRPYRKAMLPHQAYEILLASSGTHFDSELLQSFLNHVAIYPVGSTVQLNTGEFGVVTSVPSGLPFLPVIQLIADANKQKLTAGQQLKLAECPGRCIRRVLTEEDVLSLLS